MAASLKIKEEKKNFANFIPAELNEGLRFGDGRDLLLQNNVIGGFKTFSIREVPTILLLKEMMMRVSKLLNYK